MTTLISIVLIIIFAFLSAIHFYWLIGGRRSGQAVIPTKDNTTMPKMPGVIPTLIVAFGLLAIGLFISYKAGFFYIPIPTFLDKYGLWVIAGIFILRAIGEFNYVGFFKKIKHTKFGRNDTKYYSPLCLIIGILIIIVAIN
jgi:glucan phosphoethanolaminetransferase (alkaline phosphatase superfamily)